MIDLKMRLFTISPFFVLQFFSLDLAEKWEKLMGSFLSYVMVVVSFIPLIAGCLLFFAMTKGTKLFGEISILLHISFCVVIIFLYTQILDSFPLVESLQNAITREYLYPVFLVPAISFITFLIQKNVVRKIS